MFSYNIKTGYIMWHDKRIVRWENNHGALRFWYKDRGIKWYLTPFELKEFADTIRWLIRDRGCDFGESVNNFALDYPADYNEETEKWNGR